MNPALKLLIPVIGLLAFLLFFPTNALAAEVTLPAVGVILPG